MLRIKVLGPGCHRCHSVEQTTLAALESLAEEFPDLEATLEHVQDPLKIQDYPILFTPGLVVNEKLICAGRIPSKQEVVGWLQEALHQPG